MDSANVKTWWSRELAEHLDIGASTLRKWSLELEKAGYVFLRDEHGRRAYVEHDALALRQFKKYLDGGMSYDSASKAVLADYLRNDSAAITLSARSEFPQEQRDDERYEALEAKIDAQAEQIEQLIEMNRQLVQRLDDERQMRLELGVSSELRAKEAAIEAADIVKDRITELMDAQRTSAATKEQIEAVNEAIEAQRQEIADMAAGLSRMESRAKKSIWKRVFGQNG